MNDIADVEADARDNGHCGIYLAAQACRPPRLFAALYCATSALLVSTLCQRPQL